MFKRGHRQSIACVAVVLAGCTTAPRPEVEQSTLRLPLTTVGVKTMYRTVVLPAVVAPLPDREVKVVPAIDGKLTAVLIEPGQWVPRGQVIARLDSRQLADQLGQAKAKVLDAEAGVAQAKTNLLLAENTEQRQSNLVRLEVGAEKDLVAAQSQVKTAREQLLSSQAKLAEAKAAQAAAAHQLSFTNVTSPVGGLVAQRYLDVGEAAGPSAPIALIEDLSQVTVTAALPTSEPERIETGAAVIVTAAAMPGVRYLGTVSGINPMAENNGATVGVRIICNNPGFALKDGMPVSASIIVDKYADATVVPETALVDDPTAPLQKMVYVERRGTVHRVPVHTGVHEAGMVQIVSGLSPGERIVAAGAYGVPDGTKVAVQ